MRRNDTAAATGARQIAVKPARQRFDFVVGQSKGAGKIGPVSASASLSLRGAACGPILSPDWHDYDGLLTISERARVARRRTRLAATGKPLPAPRRDWRRNDRPTRQIGLFPRFSSGGGGCCFCWQQDNHNMARFPCPRVRPSGRARRRPAGRPLGFTKSLFDSKYAPLARTRTGAGPSPSRTNRLDLNLIQTNGGRQAR
jgi:hypothetical protein